MAIYGGHGGHVGGARAPVAAGSQRLRHQERRRPDDPALLGRELRPDLPGAQAARGGRLDRGRGRGERRPRAARVPHHRRRQAGARRLAARHRDADRAPRRVAAPPLLRRPAARRGGARPAARATRGIRRDARLPAVARRRKRHAGSAVRRPRVPLGARLLRMGDRMVRPAGTAADVPLTELPDPTWRLLVGRGLPQFAGEAVLPVVAFYVGWRWWGLGAGIAASTVVSLAIAAVVVRLGREVGTIALGVVFVLVQAGVALAAHSTTVYLAQPVIFSALLAL